EHDPKWREAVVDVGVVHKGDQTTKQVVIRFPSSMDVQWYRAPKFHTGDRGVWMLQHAQGAAAPAEAAGGARAGKRGKAAGKRALVATALPGATVYTALHPMDFQPANKLASVAPVIRAVVAPRNK